MSFSSEQKDTVIGNVYKSACCRRALLCGVLYAKGRVEDGEAIITLEKEKYAEFAARLIREFYGKNPEIYRTENGGRCISLRFASNSATNYITNFKNNNNRYTRKCSYCLSSFLRGVFLGSGRITSPEKQYSLEFSLGERTSDFKNFLLELDINARISEKKSGVVLYMKNSSDIEAFYGHAGMNPAMFALIEAKFRSEARKNIMRVTNCETNNIRKAVDAAAKQIQVISELDRANLLSSLPEELAETARLRLRYPDLSLSQLAQIAVPAISKPGLSHRLKKIMELGTQLLHK